MQQAATRWSTLTQAGGRLGIPCRVIYGIAKKKDSKAETIKMQNTKNKNKNTQKKKGFLATSNFDLRLAIRDSIMLVLVVGEPLDDREIDLLNAEAS